jgi:hypothetical protein
MGKIHLYIIALSCSKRQFPQSAAGGVDDRLEADGLLALRTGHSFPKAALYSTGEMFFYLFFRAHRNAREKMAFFFPSQGLKLPDMGGGEDWVFLERNCKRDKMGV